MILALCARNTVFSLHRIDRAMGALVWNEGQDFQDFDDKLVTAQEPDATGVEPATFVLPLNQMPNLPRERPAGARGAYRCGGN